MDAIRWQQHLHPVLTAALVLGLLVWVIVLYRRQRARHTGAQAAVLIGTRVLLALLLITAFLDPHRRAMQFPSKKKKVLVFVDSSASMGITDRDKQTRGQRARDLQRELSTRLGGLVQLETFEFSDQVYSPGEQSSTQGSAATDLAGCLASINARSDISSCQAAILITDGGDERVPNLNVPGLPVFIAGIGTDPEPYRDVSIYALEAPETVEKAGRIEVIVDIKTSGIKTSELRAGNGLDVQLQQRQEDRWEPMDSVQARPMGKLDRVTLTASAPAQSGLYRYRVTVEGMENELTDLNNARVFAIEVKEQGLRVLFYAQQIGWDFSAIRRELARDRAISLDALFRLTDERYKVQTDHADMARALAQGFPAHEKDLMSYRCLIIGSIPFTAWQAEQLEALLAYVRAGGAVIFLGGETSFGSGGYAGTAIEPLFPWRLSPQERELQVGHFPVTVTRWGLDHPIMAQTSELLQQAAEAHTESVNPIGTLRVGAQALLETSGGGRTLPIVALQRFGQGQTMGIATNTLWKWKRQSSILGQAYGQLWRSAVRHLSQTDKEGILLSIQWDSTQYSPGQQARALVTLPAGGEQGTYHLSTQLQHKGQTQDISPLAVTGRANTLQADMVFAEAAQYLFRAELKQGASSVETYEKLWIVGPKLSEGANIEVDSPFLTDLARRCGGAYFPERQGKNLVNTIKNEILDTVVSAEIPLVQDRFIYLGLFLIACALEWAIRRRMNLF
jgi:uncharacterized membrane protein